MSVLTETLQVLLVKLCRKKNGKGWSESSFKKMISNDLRISTVAYFVLYDYGLDLYWLYVCKKIDIVYGQHAFAEIVECPQT